MPKENNIKILAKLYVDSVEKIKARRAKKESVSMKRILDCWNLYEELKEAVKNVKIMEAKNDT